MQDSEDDVLRTPVTGRSAPERLSSDEDVLHVDPKYCVATLAAWRTRNPTPEECRRLVGTPALVTREALNHLGIRTTKALRQRCVHADRHDRVERPLVCDPELKHLFWAFLRRANKPGVVAFLNRFGRNVRRKEARRPGEYHSTIDPVRRAEEFDALVPVVVERQTTLDFEVLLAATTNGSSRRQVAG